MSLIDFMPRRWYDTHELNILIKSGGGTGPVKPGNRESRCQFQKMRAVMTKYTSLPRREAFFVGARQYLKRLMGAWVAKEFG